MKRFLYLTTATAGLVAVLVAAGGVRAHADSLMLQGQAYVADNATLQIWGQRVRLQDIVVPDPTSGEGREGKQFLQHLVNGVTVHCMVSAPIHRGPIPGRCFAGRVDIGKSLVAAGHARDAKQTSKR